MAVAFDSPAVKTVLHLSAWAKWARPCLASNVGSISQEGWAVKEDLLEGLLFFVLSASLPFWCRRKWHKLTLRGFGVVLLQL